MWVDVGEGDRGLAWCVRAVTAAPDDIGVAYNAACLYAKLGERTAALDCLERSVACGLSQRAWLERDPDWDAFRADPRFVGGLLARSAEAEIYCDTTCLVYASGVSNSSTSPASVGSRSIIQPPA